MTRKSPYKHTVRRHKRRGKPIKSYERGKGDQPELRKRIMVNKKNNGEKSGKEESFYITIKYPDFTSEGLDIRAKGFPNALDSGVESRKMYKMPITIIMSRRSA